MPDYIEYTNYCIVQNGGGGGNFGEFGKFGAIRQSFTHPNLYHKTAGINSATNQYQKNSWEHA